VETVHRQRSGSTSIPVAVVSSMALLAVLARQKVCPSTRRSLPLTGVEEFAVEETVLPDFSTSRLLDSSFAIGFLH
jgi:hypothetical protein